LSAFPARPIRHLFTTLITVSLIACIFHPFVEIPRRRFNLTQVVASRWVYFLALTTIIACST